ncbi:unnamed protein product, partial [Tilletia laevis]
MKFTAGLVTLAILLASSNAAPVNVERDPLQLSAGLGSKALGTAASLKAGLAGVKGVVSTPLGGGGVGLALPRDPLTLSAGLGSKALGTAASL